MKRLLFLLLIVGAACSSPQKTKQNLITVSVLPQKYFVEKIAGDLVEVQVLVPPGASPATYSLLPSQMKDLSDSRAWLRIGKIGFENAWHEKIQQSNPKLEIFDTSDSTQWIYGEEEVHGDHVHQHGVDPHNWMSPNEVVKIAELTFLALIDLFPEHAQAFDTNFKVFRSEIEQLDQELNVKFARLQNRKFLIFHPALTYFARDYSLVQVPMEVEGKEPSPKYMSELVKHSRKDRIRVVFIQKEFDLENAQQLAKELDGEVVQIDPLSEHWEAQIREIADKIVAASE